jgi:hypothetical protein
VPSGLPGSIPGVGVQILFILDETARFVEKEYLLSKKQFIKIVDYKCK